eukprot:scaffold2602_cov246-Pinguiococcus_pyrenoidosus.AAC.10
MPRRAYAERIIFAASESISLEGSPSPRDTLRQKRSPPDEARQERSAEVTLSRCTSAEVCVRTAVKR